MGMREADAAVGGATRRERGLHGNSLQASTSDIRLEDISATSMARQSSVSVWESATTIPLSGCEPGCEAGIHAHARGPNEG
jgi:hypothetical protein